MKNNNLKIAEMYSRQMKQRCGRVWISDNLPQLASGDRKAILKVYRKHFHTVDYDPATGICKCWVIDPATDNNLDFGKGSVAEFISEDLANTGSKANQPISQATRDALGIGETDHSELHILDSDRL